MHPVRHPTPSPRSEPFYILWFFSDLALILTEDFLIFPQYGIGILQCAMWSTLVISSPSPFLSKLHPVWMSHSSNCSFPVLQLGTLKYASFNTTLEQHILEPQIMCISATFKLLKRWNNNSLSTLDIAKTRNNRPGLEKQRFRLVIGAS